MTISLQQVGIRQSKAETVVFHVTGATDATALITEGKYHGTIVDNDTGDYTITFARPGRRVPSVVGLVSHTADCTLYVSAVSATAITIKSREVDETDAAKDADLDVTLLMYYDPSQR